MTVSDLLRLLKTNEWPWANRSGRSCQKRDCERIPQVAHDKWATVSELLRLLMSKERLSANCSGCSGQMSIREWIAQVAHVKRETVSELLRSLMTNERPWAICSDCSGQMSDVSESLRSLTKNERPWAIRSGRSPNMSLWVNHSFFWVNGSLAHFFERIAHLLFFSKNKQFAQKTDERIPSPAPRALKHFF